MWVCVGVRVRARACACVCVRVTSFEICTVCCGVLQCVAVCCSL